MLDEENDGLVFEGGRLYRYMIWNDDDRCSKARREKADAEACVCVVMMEEGERCSRGGRE